MHKVDKRLYVNADRSKVVEEDDPDAAFLYAIEGSEISDEDAKRYGLDKAKGKAETKAVEAAPENKAEDMPHTRQFQSRGVQKLEK